KNQPAIEACFRDQAANVSGSPEISVRFTIDAAGAVQRAELSPPELANVPLGTCILGVARSTRFPAESGPATFRIPLRARKLP
ncbi:MAG: Endo,4-beta-xylanase precursor, partial [Myxococcaceae bacterium]|nr:Endo,4-beta-xylanase precursor [Myxococcaceae bacterium]